MTTKKLLHTHPVMEKITRMGPLHVIVTKEDREKALAILNRKSYTPQFIVNELMDCISLQDAIERFTEQIENTE